MTSDMTAKLKAFATLALVCAWPLVNFAIFNSALLSGSGETVNIIFAVFTTALLFSFAVLFVLNKIFGRRNEVRCTLAACMVIILFFSYPQLLSLWDYIFTELNLSIAPHYGYAGTFVVLPALVLFFVNRPIFLQLTFVFSIMIFATSVAEFLLVSTSINAEETAKIEVPPDSNAAHVAPLAMEPSDFVPPENSDPNSSPTGKKRHNVYHIVADSYARADQLKSILKFDNSDFLNELEKQGFNVITGARSNYPYTGFSLSSMFSMDYPYTESSGTSKASSPYGTLGSIKPVIQKIWDLGYQYAHIGAKMWGGAGCPDHPDVVCLTPSNARVSDRSIEILDAINRMTPLSYFVSINAKFGEITTVYDVRKTIVSMDVTRPFVLFAHTLPPHVPYTSRADCSDQPAVQFNLTGGSDPKKYLEALQCVNKRLLAFAEFIAENDPDSIVVFQSDHGSKFLSEETLPLDAWTTEQLNERFSIFLAIKAPDYCRDMLIPDFSLVNLYRFIFACIDETEPQYLENRFYNVSYGFFRPGKRHFGSIQRLHPNDFEY